MTLLSPIDDALGRHDPHLMTPISKLFGIERGIGPKPRIERVNDDCSVPVVCQPLRGYRPRDSRKYVDGLGVGRVPPNKPEIYNETGHPVTSETGAAIIGPYNEGDPLDLTCKVSGGRPSPKVEWLVNDEVRVTEEKQDAGGVIQLDVSIDHLARKHLHAVFECRATNYNESVPVSSTVTLDMNFQPMNVSILSGSSSLSATTEYELVCKAWGSRPAAAITWWKGGTQSLKDAAVTTSPDGNVTTSILKYKADMSDNGKYLTCRAENPLITQSSREDGIKLNIFYKPVVTLQMASSLNPESIKEGDDVYFECHINANPEVQQVNWYHNGSPVTHRVLRGIIIQNQTLVLQKISRESAGLYTCRAVNLEGEGESQPVDLRVLYKPYCKRHSKTIYGTALHEPASVTCEVEANPGPVTFRWTFNNTSEHLPIPSSAVESQDFTSIASYAPKGHLDYGTLLCWAYNDIGEQTDPCGFTIIAAGPPDPPRNCSANQTTHAIEVTCVAGFDGGLNQVFYIEVYDSTTGELHRNISSSDPFFVLTALRPGIAFLMMTYAANAKGRSATSKLETFTLKVAEKRTGPPTLFEFTPVLGILIGVVLALILTALVIMVIMKMRKPLHSAGGGSRDELKGADLENKPLNVGVLAARVKDGNAGTDNDDKNPDIIPQKNDVVSYQDYEAIDRSGTGRVGSNMDSSVTIRTLPRTPKESTPTTPVAEVTYTERPLVMTSAQPGYQVSATDLCLFAAKRRSAYLPLLPTTSIASPKATNFTTTTTTASSAGAVATSASISTNSSPTPQTSVASVSSLNGRYTPVESAALTLNSDSRAASPHIYAAIDQQALKPVASQNGGKPDASLGSKGRRSVHFPASTSAHVYATITRPTSTVDVSGVSTLNPTANIYATIDSKYKTSTVSTTSIANKRHSYVTLGNWNGMLRKSVVDNRDSTGSSLRSPGSRFPYESAV